MHATAFHLRERILERFYGFKQIKEVIKNDTDFPISWQNDENHEFQRKFDKILNFNKISPKQRNIEFHSKRAMIQEDFMKKSKYIKQQRKMTFIKWPYDTSPIFGVTKEKSEERQKYLKRLTSKMLDYDKKVTLPMQVNPLKYLAYWELQKNIININQNCLCSFNYCLEN